MSRYVYQAPGCLTFRKRENRAFCEDPRCEACHGNHATRYLCARGADGPHSCRLEPEHPGPHTDLIKWEE